MILAGVVLFFIVIVLGSYVLIRYNQSRNKKLFFKHGGFKSFIWLLGLAILSPIIVNTVFPSEALNLDFLKLHTEYVSDYEIYNEQGDLLRYYFFMSLSVLTEIHVFGLLSALMIFGVWYYYIRSLDFFDKEKISYTIIVVLTGCLCSFFTFPMSDAVHHLFNISFSENTFYNLFVYSFVGIGIIEEFVKLLPVLLIFFFTKQIDEPIDFIYYASLSALGFALIENLMYFRDITGPIIIARALTAAIGHMVDSSIVIYGFILAYYRNSGSKFPTIIKYFLLGAFAHAMYDYLLFERFLLLFLFFFVFLIQSWVIIINNAINNSKFFDYSISFKHDIVKFRTAEYLMFILILNYFFLALALGKSEANMNYFISVSFGGMLILFYVSSISSFDLVKGYWRPVRFQTRPPSDEALPGVRGVSTLSTLFTANIIQPLNHVGKKIRLHCPRFNPNLMEIFDMGDGKIVDRFRMIIRKKKRSVEDTNWFLVILRDPLDVNDEYEDRKILIKVKDTFASLLHDEHIKCWLKLIPAGTDPRTKRHISEYPSMGYIMINGEDYKHDFEQ